MTVVEWCVSGAKDLRLKDEKYLLKISLWGWNRDEVHTGLDTTGLLLIQKVICLIRVNHPSMHVWLWWLLVAAIAMAAAAGRISSNLYRRQAAEYDEAVGLLSTDTYYESCSHSNKNWQPDNAVCIRRVNKNNVPSRVCSLIIHLFNSIILNICFLFHFRSTK